ncbi:histidinol-phosphate transaminase [Candidatus Sumerlaeota bacterium]|nr:histidinol-phosphate transaminase [Candidatus Sumerlaeota bacterium]
MKVMETELVKNLEPYAPGEQPQEAGFTKLNTNENPYPPAPEVVLAIQTLDANDMRKYPDPVCGKLRRILSEKHNVTPDWIFAGNGSDEVLRLIFQAYLAPGDVLGITDPTYSLYPVLARMFGAKVKIFDLGPEGELPRNPEISSCKIFALANPNPPYGVFYPLSEVEKLACSSPSTLFIIDEAYVDFARGDSLDIIHRCENALISRSFSKSFSLAGMRVGYTVGPSPLIRNLYKIKDSYNVNSASQAAACAALHAAEYYKEISRKIIEDRIFVTRELRKLGFKAYDSEGNFVFAESGDGKTLYEKLKAKKILVRYFDLPRLKKGVRITIGTHEEMLSLVETLRNLI